MPQDRKTVEWWEDGRTKTYHIVLDCGHTPIALSSAALAETDRGIPVWMRCEECPDLAPPPPPEDAWVEAFREACFGRDD